MIENTNPSALQPCSHSPHVFGALKAGADRFAGLLIDRVRVAALVAETSHVRVRLVEYPVHPVVVGQVSTELLPISLGLRPPLGIRDDVPDSRSRRRSGSRRTAVALVDEDHFGTSVSGIQRSPRRGRSTAKNEHVRLQGELLSHQGSPVLECVCHLGPVRRRARTAVFCVVRRTSVP